MKIGVDLRPLALGASGGTAPLIKMTFEYAIRLFPEHEFVVFCTAFNRSLFEVDAPNTRHFVFPITTYFAELDRVAREESIEVLFRSYPMHDPLSYPMSRQIVLIPDIQHEVYPEFFDEHTLRIRRLAFSRTLRSAGAIATISNFAQKSLVDFNGTDCEDIFLMEPAVYVSGDGDGKLAEEDSALVPREPFFLFPANLWKHKNHRGLLEAFKLFREGNRRNVSLILTGHPDGWDEIAKQFPGLPVKHYGFVRPRLLRALLQRAEALAFFSLYEGFGMPLLEAFDAGTPVICSNTTSLPEVGGDAVLSCNPRDPVAIADLMERVCSDKELRRLLVERGRLRLQSYSWENAAREFIAACTRVTSRAGAVRSPALLSRKPLPLVSIVTPSFNQGKFLRRTINSVLGQTYPRVEYVVTDGGSTDESVGILKAFGTSFAWVSEPDRGQTHAINKGMSRVSGEILGYLNSDDVLLPGALDRVVRYFQDHPDCDAVYGEADYINEDDAVTGQYPTADYSFDRLVESCIVCQPAMFWRRRIAYKVGTFDEDLNYVMDYDYWFRIARAGGTIHHLPEKLACSRLYAQTKTLSARGQIYAEIFRISRKHAGRVHKSYFDGYWHHLIHERHGPISRLIRKVPNLYMELSWFHYSWYHRYKHSWTEILRFSTGTLPKRLLSVLVRLLPKLAPVLPSPQAPRSARVSGYWADSWLAPTVRVVPRERAPGEILFMGGTAPVDLQMRVRAGRAEIGSFQFKANQYKKISFPADLVNGHPVEIESSAFIIDPVNRRLSFLLQDTNLFLEQDIA